MAKQYRQRESGLFVPEWLPLSRPQNILGKPKGFMFSPSGGCGCCGPTCSNCKNGAASDELVVVISGVTNGTTCPNCSSIVNGTFVLAYDGNCYWSASVSGTLCDPPCYHTGLTIHARVDSSYVLSVYWSSSSSLCEMLMKWTKTYDEAPDCTAFNNASLTPFAYNNCCVFTSSTCYVTSA